MKAFENSGILGSPYYSRLLLQLWITDLIALALGIWSTIIGATVLGIILICGSAIGLVALARSSQLQRRARRSGQLPKGTEGS